jgi:hypothetical protein
MQGIAGGTSITPDQLARFPGAALFAFANPVGGALIKLGGAKPVAGQFSSNSLPLFAAVPPS